jgi:hypothetical protein
MQSVIVTPGFESDAKQAALSSAEIEAIILWLAANPLAGDLMKGTGGARKVRFAGKGKGKSGGYRSVHYFGGDDIPLFLLALIDKGERANLSKAEQNALAAELAGLAEDYRAGVAASLRRRR